MKVVLIVEPSGRQGAHLTQWDQAILLTVLSSNENVAEELLSKTTLRAAKCPIHVFKV